MNYTGFSFRRATGDRQFSSICKAATVLLLGSGLLAWAQPQYTISTFAGGVAPATPAVATAISIGGTTGVAVDASGNLYLSTQLHCIFKVTNGSVTVVAGTCRPGFSGDGSTATSGQLNGPAAVAFDNSGSLYVADRNNHRIRKITSGGIISTVAGNGTSGYSGDGGQATSAQFNRPAGVAVDSAGNLYIADTGNNSIRKVSAAGIVSTIGGTGVAGFSGDGGAATNAQLNLPSGVALDTAGNLYIADQGNNRVREISSGNISTVAGNGIQGYAGDGGSATAARLSGPTAVAVDGSNNIYISDLFNSVVRRVSGGIIQTFVGTGNAGFSGDGGTATSAQLNSPTGVAADATGKLFIADNANNRVRQVSSGVIATVAGNGAAGFSGDGGQATSAQMALPSSAVLDPAGNLYVADTANNRVRKITTGGAISTVAGNGTAGYSGDGGQATAAQLNSPAAVAVDSFGNVFIADTANHRIREVSTGGVISTIAGNGTPGYSGDGGAATSAQLNNPAGLAVDTSGNVYISDTVNSRVREVISGTINTIAGTGIPGYKLEGTATGAQVNFPAGLALDNSGNLYIADRFNNRIRKLSGGVISTVAGNGVPGFSGDGGAAMNAEINGPNAVAVDGSGNLYIADASNNRVRYVSNGGSITTIAGTGVGGFSGDGGVAINAQVDSPMGIAVDSSGKVYVAESAANDVRRLTPVLVTVTADSVTPASGTGSSQTFGLQYSDSNGGSDISQAWVWMNASFGSSAANSCMMFYSKASNGLLLLNDAGSAWSSPAAIGTAGTLSNGQCSVNLGTSSLAVSGTHLTLNLAMTFTGAFAGAKSVFGYATNGNVNSGWHTLGTWTVPAGSAVVVTADSATPSSGNGSSQTFALQYSDSNGGGDLSQAWVWVNASFASSAANSCMMFYNKAAGGLELLNDAGNGWSSPAAIGTSRTLSNSQCSVNLGSSSLAASGTHLTLNLALTFTGAFAGGKSVFGYATNGSVNSGWQTLGSWTVPSGGGTGGSSVTADSVSPSSGTGTSQTFALQYSDSSGGTDISQAWVWMNASFGSNAANSCMLFYSKASNGVLLLNDAGNAWSSPAAIGTAGTLSNSQCSVNLGSSSLGISGTHLTLNLAITFTGAYAGTKSIFAYATNGTVNSSWQTLGTWTVPSSAVTVTADSVTPGSGSGTSQTFSFQYSDSNGGSDLSQGWIWINASFASNAANSCMMFYSKASNGLLLLNDAGSAWSAPAPIGTAGTLSNSQCSVNLGSSSLVISGTHLTLNLAITFSSAYNGAKSVFMYGTNGSVNSGWQARGTWTVP